MRPVVIAVAITASVRRKKDNPAIPVTVNEQIESTREAYEAGAAIGRSFHVASLTSFSRLIGDMRYGN
jgi:uncharacterized protein (DUF849 family)